MNDRFERGDIDHINVRSLTNRRPSLPSAPIPLLVRKLHQLSGDYEVRDVKEHLSNERSTWATSRLWSVVQFPLGSKGKSAGRLTL